LLGGAGHDKALRDRLFNYAVNLLARAARTERELRRRLSRPVWSTPALVDDVVSALKRYGYVDDEDFARRFAERRAAGGRSGARLLRLELRAKGVEDREVIEEAVREAFERAPEADAIDALIARRTRGRPITDPDDLRRLRDFLLRRGFDPETVYERLRRIGRDFDD
jgi:regulatory protein